MHGGKHTYGKQVSNPCHAQWCFSPYYRSYFMLLSPVYSCYQQLQLLHQLVILMKVGLAPVLRKLTWTCSLLSRRFSLRPSPHQLLAPPRSHLQHQPPPPRYLGGIFVGQVSANYIQHIVDAAWTTRCTGCITNDAVFQLWHARP